MNYLRFKQAGGQPCQIKIVLYMCSIPSKITGICQSVDRSNIAGYLKILKLISFTMSYLGALEMQEIYERWLSCGENWKKSTWAISLSKTSTENKRGARRWMTKAQIENKYSSAEIAEEICELKDTPEFEHQRKRHPDLPHRDDPFLQYNLINNCNILYRS